MSERPVKYLLDSNVFIEAHRTYYSFDLCPGFWSSIIWHHGSGNLVSLDKVRDELIHEADVLAQWLEDEIPESGFVATDDPAVIEQFGQMQVWAQGQAQYKPEAKAEFATVADAWLAAYAKVHNLVLVTHEVYSADAKKKVPLPNVCKAFDVQWTDTFKMLRALDVKFRWQN